MSYKFSIIASFIIKINLHRCPTSRHSAYENIVADKAQKYIIGLKDDIEDVRALQICI